MTRNPGCSSGRFVPSSSPAWESASQEAGSIGNSILESPSAESLIVKFAGFPVAKKPVVRPPLLSFQVEWMGLQ